MTPVTVTFYDDLSTFMIGFGRILLITIKFQTKFVENFKIIFFNEEL
jgi:hypothetical protein